MYVTSCRKIDSDVVCVSFGHWLLRDVNCKHDHDAFLFVYFNDMEWKRVEMANPGFRDEDTYAEIPEQLQVCRNPSF